jgi:hypothetical protein
MPPTAESSRAGVTVRELTDGESLSAFIDLSWTMNAADPYWVPPLRMSVSTALNRAKHPFHRHAEVAYFLAERGGKPVGRIAAIANRLHNEYHKDRVGFFGSSARRTRTRRRRSSIRLRTGCGSGGWR